MFPWRSPWPRAEVDYKRDLPAHTARADRVFFLITRYGMAREHVERVMAEQSVHAPTNVLLRIGGRPDECLSDSEP